MATKDLSKVESTNLSDSVNLLAEDGGEIRRVSYAELQAKLDAINESIEEFNMLVNNENVKIQTLESQFVFAESVEEMNANVSKLALYRTYPCFLSAQCVVQLIPDVSIAAKGYVARPSETIIDLYLFIGEDDVVYGRYNTSTETFAYNTVCSKADFDNLVNSYNAHVALFNAHVEDKENPHTVTLEQLGAAALSHEHEAGEITSGTLGVARGGTGATTFTSGAALIGAGTGAVTTRSITNLTSKGVATANTNLTTANTLIYHSQARLNRTTNVNATDTNYSTYMARGIALVSSAPSSLTDGCCAFVYQ